MSKKELCSRYLVFFIGLFISAFGVSLITKADLGTSPISSIPYVLSLHYAPTLGEFTIGLSVVLIVLQFFILRHHFKWIHLLQIPVSVAFGYFIDISMYFLSFLHPETYGVKVFCLFVGCIVLGIGVYGEVLGNVIMLPGESFVKAVVFVWNKEFGTVKIAFDVSMTLIAAALSYLLMGKIVGLGIGTVVAAFFVGAAARFLGRRLSFLPEKLFGSAPLEQAHIEEMLAAEEQ